MPDEQVHATSESDQLGGMTPAEVMAGLSISRRTLNRYVGQGLLSFTRLPSGHRRFRRADVAALQSGEPVGATS